MGTFPEAGGCGCEDCGATAGIGLFTAAGGAKQPPPRKTAVGTVEPGPRWTLTFDGMPGKNQNSREHYYDRARTVRQWRRLGALQAKRAGIPRLQRVRISVTVYRRNLNVADEPGDWERIKPIIDGLVDAGVVPSDTRRYVEYGHCEEAHGLPAVRVVVEALGGAAEAE